MTHEQRMQQRQDRLAQYRALIEEHAQAIGQLRDLHARYLALERDPAVSVEARRAQLIEIVRAEGKVLKQAQPIVEAILRFLREPR